MNSPKKLSYESMGTGWEVVVWDFIEDSKFSEIQKEILMRSKIFDNTYSRFIKDSLVWKIAQNAGVYKVPKDFVLMLQIYKDLFLLSEGKLTPLIGFTLSDMGYDIEYSLKAKKEISFTLDFNDSLMILDSETIETKSPILIDIGALGKGYFVDLISKYLIEQGLSEFLVNGSGDIYYQGSGLLAGLEHPTDKTKVIGSVNITSGSLCASGTDRRKWGEFNHIIDPTSYKASSEIISTWVMADSAALADGLSTALFLTPPENFLSKYKFEYCILNKDMQIKRSSSFNAQFY